MILAINTKKEFIGNASHEVLDLVYTKDEGQKCFQGTEQECYSFIEEQGGATFMYKVVPIIN